MKRYLFSSVSTPPVFLFNFMIWMAVTVLPACVFAASSDLTNSDLTNSELTKEETQPSEQVLLNEEVEILKEEVLKLNRDLFILEEDLLFPASTQFNLYVSSDAQAYFELDAVKIKINNKMITTHLYTENQKSALLRGGIQKLHVGNIKAGDHELVAIFTGKGPESRDYKRAVTHKFTKTIDPIHLEIKISDESRTQQPHFEVAPWQD